jgi:hypothetical protein
VVFAAWCWGVGTASAAITNIVEPDDFPTGTFVLDAYPGVLLHTDAQFGNVVISTSSLAPTGQRVFNQGQIPPYPWTNTSGGHTFIADFATPVTSVSIFMFTSGIFEESPGRIEAYNAMGAQVASVTSDTIHYQQPQEISLARPAGDISSIHVYGTNASIGLDRLTYINVPTPSAGLLFGAIGISTFAPRKRRHAR